MGNSGNKGVVHGTNTQVVTSPQYVNAQSHQHPPPPPNYTQPPPPPYGYHNQPQMQNRMAPGGHVVVQGGFDPGARMVNGQAPSIPPPPPGCAPNAAQMAQIRGQNVTVTQQQANWFEGGPGGGAVIW